MNAEHWCCCRKYCHGQRKCLKSLRTWQRHLQEADEDEKPRVRAARLSRSFQNFVATTMNNAPAAGPSLMQPPIASGSGRTPSSTTSSSSSDDDRPSRKRRCGSGELFVNDVNLPHPPGSPDNDQYIPEPDFDALPRDLEGPDQDQRDETPPAAHWHNPLKDLDLDQLGRDVKRFELQRDMQFILALHNATLDDGAGLIGDALERLRNPPQAQARLDDSDIEHCWSISVVLPGTRHPSTFANNTHSVPLIIERALHAGAIITSGLAYTRNSCFLMACESNEYAQALLALACSQPSVSPTLHMTSASFMPPPHAYSRQHMWGDLSYATPQHQPLAHSVTVNSATGASVWGRDDHNMLQTIDIQELP
ncbi:uncharacterized protein BJ212DRAFT_1576814 [Suillus subaureus]|uniref:Uncharacterized protein n=1 Tax=Suillus subaureus TaxID=48587 RepID=A0A9P7ECW3_9AGAM|nr:uncharacterized protein BJ212DRAFT_1576814 [Suillus subaureus]KAG1817176.1 hypothetical protein BJ212DRAFT_1576814 [Suillus subaureus]